jgi:signal transduction histidine kinase
MTQAPPDRITVLVHEVRSPIAALAAIAEALPDLVDPDARRELVRLAVSACQAIERIVTDIAVASVRPVPVDIGSLVGDVVAARAVAGVTVRADVGRGLPVVEADPIRLRQALDNLVTNALVHGGGRVIVRAAPCEGGVTLSVSDGGGGMGPADAARVFEPGVRLGQGGSGFGIGLALTKAIVDAHSGTIAVESSEGLGATFTITLPVDRTHPDT